MTTKILHNVQTPKLDEKTSFRLAIKEMGTSFNRKQYETWREENNGIASLTVVVKYGSWEAVGEAFGFEALPPYTDEQIQAFFDLAKQELVEPIQAIKYAEWAHKNNAPNVTVLRKLYGSWKKIGKKFGFRTYADLAEESYSREEVQAIMDLAKKEFGLVITQNQYNEWANEKGYPTSYLLKKEYGGTWQVIAETFGFQSNLQKRKTIDESRIVEAIEAVKKEFGPVVSVSDYEYWAKGKDVPCVSVIRRQFGSWPEVGKRFGFQTPTRAKKTYTKEEVRTVISTCVAECGSPLSVVTYTEWAKSQKKSLPTSTYLSNHYGGTWRQVGEAFGFEVPGKQSHTPSDEQIETAVKKAQKELSSPIARNDYEKWAKKNEQPSVYQILKKFNSWDEVAETFGFEVPKKGVQIPDRTQVTTSLKEAKVELGRSMNKAVYNKWAKKNGKPSAQQVLNHFKTWKDVTVYIETEYKGSQTFEKDQITNALKTARKELGWYIKKTAYDKWAKKNEQPSAYQILKRFNSWKDVTDYLRRDLVG